MLRAMGAEVVLTRSDVPKGHPDYYQDLAARIAQGDGRFLRRSVQQSEQSGCARTHHRPRDLGADGGQGRCRRGWRRLRRDDDRAVPVFRARFSATEMVLADPKGSVLADYIHTGVVGEAGSWLVEGIGEDFIPPVSDLSRVRKAYTISDGESFAAARTVLRKEGLLAGSSSGTLIAAAQRYCLEQTEPKRVVTFICDSGNKYLSKMYDDRWMVEQGLLQRPGHGDLARSHCAPLRRGRRRDRRLGATRCKRRTAA